MWRKPIRTKALRDTIQFIAGMAGMGYMILHGPMNVIVFLVFYAMTGAQGVSSITQLVTSQFAPPSPPQVAQSSPSGTTSGGPESSSPGSPSSRSSPS